MSDLQAKRSNVEVQLGARARSILRTLSLVGADKRASSAQGDAAGGKLDERPEQGGASLFAVEPAARSRAELRAARIARHGTRPGDAAAMASQTPRVSGEVSDNTVVPLPARAVPRRQTPMIPAEGDVLPPARRRGTKQRTSVVKISAMLSIALPTLLATVYFAFLAAPQYVAEARFAVRGPADLPSTTGIMGAITGIGGGSLAMSPDSFIVAQYIESGQMVAKLNATIDLRSVYTNENADFVARYRPYDFTDTIEHLTRYWNEVSWVYFEPVTGIITLTVRAFTPDDALRIARETVRESEKLVNELSQRAQADSLMQAKQEQSRAELRMKFARKAIQQYRDRQGAPDAQSVVDAQFKIVAQLEGDLAKQEAEFGASSSFLNKDAPTIRFMQKNIDSLKARVAAERAKIGSEKAKSGDGTVMSASMAEFETLATEREFAEKSYMQASLMVDSARVSAERQSRYLATFVQPYLPEDSLYPARLQMILLVLVCSTLSWGIGVLIFYGIRDHSA